MLPLLLLAVWPPPRGSAQASPAHALEGGAALFEQRRYSAAKVRLHRVTSERPDDARAASYLGRIALIEGNAKAAVQWFERAIRAAPQTAEYHRWLGRAYAREVLRASKLRAAMIAPKIRNAFETAVALAPDDVEARLDLLQFHLVAPGVVGGSTSKARAQAQEIGRRNEYRGTLAAGMIAEHDGDLEAARRTYEEAVRAFPDSGPAYYRLAAFHQRTGAYADAIRTFEELLERRPDEHAVHYHIGRTGSVSGDQLERAERALRTYLAKPPREGDPSLASAHYRLALVLQQRGDTVGAKQEYALTVSLDPAQRDARDALKRLP